METGLAVVIVSLYCGYAAGGAESGADNVKYVQLGDSQRFCCPAISYCSSHSTVISWYRCVDTELSAESCQQPVPGVKSKQLPVGSAWVSETGELSFFNFSLQAVGTYCCTQHDNARQCVKMSILPSVQPLVTAVENSSIAEDGGTITLECNRLVEGAPNPYVFWRHNGAVVANGNKYKITISTNSTKLTITNVTSSDSGVYVCAVVVRDMESSSLISLNVSDPPTVLGGPLFMHLHNMTSVGQLAQPAEVTNEIRASLQSYMDQHYHGVSIVMDWLLPHCCNSDVVYKFRLNGTQAVRVGQLLAHMTAYPTTIIDHLTVSSFTAETCCRVVPSGCHKASGGDTSDSDNLILLCGIAVLIVVLVCLVTMVAISYQCYRKKSRSHNKQVIHKTPTSHQYNRLKHLSNSQLATTSTAAPDPYLLLQSPTRHN